MSPALNVRALFLKEFIKQIIANYYSVQQTNLRSPKENFHESLKLVPASAQNNPSSEEKNEPIKIITLKEIDETSPNNTNIAEIKKELPIQQKNHALKKDYFKEWMNDPAIESIECEGDGRQILLKRNKAITQSAIELNKNEIKSIIEQLSEQTQTPVKEGILKAETSAWSVLAVMSEFGGSRFLVQKKQMQ